MDVLPNMLQEQEIRAENLIWAINEDYDLPIDLELLAKTGIEELDWYRVILFGDGDSSLPLLIKDVM